MQTRALPRAIDALKRGWPVVVTDGDIAITVLSVETADDETLVQFENMGKADLLISHERAATLKITNQADGAGPAVKIVWSGTVAEALAIADPARDLSTPLKGPFRAVSDVSGCAQSALKLARMAGLLPALFVIERSTSDDTTVSVEDIASWTDPISMAIVSRAKLPVEASEDAEIVGFRHRASGEEHVALVIGRPNGNPPLVRLHSECLTGDVLGSLKCDCGPQLHAALARIAESGWGILLYMRQEGRGIGLINKLRAYQLQDQGFDTVDANLRLGFGVDERDFGLAAGMLKSLGQYQVRLLTNNLDKVQGLSAQGIDVVERFAHALPPNPHNDHYLITKRDKTGHQL